MTRLVVWPWLHRKRLSLTELSLRRENHFQMSPVLGRGGGQERTGVGEHKAQERVARLCQGVLESFFTTLQLAILYCTQNVLRG